MFLKIVNWKGYQSTDQVIINTRYISEIYPFTNPSMIGRYVELIMASGSKYIISETMYQEIMKAINEEVL